MTRLGLDGNCVRVRVVVANEGFLPSYGTRMATEVAAVRPTARATCENVLGACPGAGGGGGGVGSAAGSATHPIPCVPP
eukprot:COSAG01_NODE_12015_length_1816_cov_2.577752_3_plen_79_part_00